MVMISIHSHDLIVIHHHEGPAFLSAERGAVPPCFNAATRH